MVHKYIHSIYRRVYTRRTNIYTRGPLLPPLLCLRERQGSDQRWDPAPRVVRTQVHGELVGAPHSPQSCPSSSTGTRCPHVTAPWLTLGTLPQQKVSSKAGAAQGLPYVNIGNAIKAALCDGVRVNKSVIPFQAGLMACGMLLLEEPGPVKGLGLSSVKNTADAFVLIATEAGAAGRGEGQTLPLAVADTRCVRHWACEEARNGRGSPLRGCRRSG